MKIRLMGLMAMMLLLGSCKKDADLIEVPNCDLTVPAPPVQHILSKYAMPEQQFYIRPGIDTTIRTASAYRITIPAGLRRIYGQPMSGSLVQVRVREITKRSEMIFSHAPTISDGRLLESAGMFSIRLSQDGQQVVLAPNASLDVTTVLPPALSTTAGMGLFSALSSPADSSLIGSWFPLQPSNITLFPGSGTATGFQVSLSAGLYNASANRLNWINCDRFVTASPLTTVQVRATRPGITSANTIVYLAFNTLNSALRVYPAASASDTFVAGQVPQGYSVTAVVLHMDGNQLYFGKQTATVAANQTFAPTLRAVTEAEMVAEIRAL
ncbi:hypothetical protein [Hymenobacter sp. APR13]|uniref:hypothetical protein n=1 Tax=Hymenobacter sp. APR13 TaxID=1356852 RepID=UPI0004E067E9|nr:hypothetical protein [Hymenobacter sp. APR13]AII50588.1 hypothetical protein N008_01140 [Hymenobacter sp. APR13]